MSQAASTPLTPSEFQATLRQQIEQHGFVGVLDDIFHLAAAAESTGLQPKDAHNTELVVERVLRVLHPGPKDFLSEKEVKVLTKASVLNGRLKPRDL